MKPIDLSLHRCCFCSEIKEPEDPIACPACRLLLDAERPPWERDADLPEGATTP